MMEQDVTPFEIRRNGKEYIFRSESSKGEKREIRTKDINDICKLVLKRSYFEGNHNDMRNMQ